MKRTLLFLCLALTPAIIGPLFSANAQDTLPVPSISVVGHGEVQSKPNIAEISVGVTTQNEDAAEAVRENSDTMDRLLQDLKSRGLAQKDLQTEEFSISPQYEHEQDGRRQPRIIGYSVTNRVRVRVRDLTKLGDILNEVTHGGANQVHGIQFSISDPETTMDDARLLAVADARRKAELYAKAAGARVGKALKISEQNASTPLPQMRMMAMAGGSSVPVVSGEVAIGADVSIIYELQ